MGNLPLSEGLSSFQAHAVTLAENGVCSAGAGAGKTFVLSQRYLAQLVRESNPLEVHQILALTFTKKAAGEMYSRIYQALGNHQDVDPRIGAGFRNFDRAAITTLDSFCKQIAVQGSSRYGIPPGFTIDPRALKGPIDQEIRSFLQDHQQNPVFRSYVSIFGLGTVWSEVLSPLAVKMANPVPLVPSIEESLEEQIARVTQVGKNALKDLAVLGEILSNYMDSREEEKRTTGKSAAARSLTQKEEEARQLTRTWANLSPDIPFADLDLQKLSTLPRQPSRSEVLDDEFVEHWQRAKRLAQEQLPLAVALERLKPQGRTLAPILEDLRQRIIAIKQRTGFLDFSDLILLAIQVLEDDGELADYYRNRFGSLMIDEFQDNNGLQKRLLFLLAAKLGHRGPVTPADLRPGVLFFVGDEKQSIYRFRGADVGVFKSLSTELSQAALARGARAEDAQAVLPVNYRSNPALIRYFNTLFPKVFHFPGKVSDNLLSMAADFVAIDPRTEDAAEPAPLIEAWIQPPRPDEDTSPLSVQEGEFLAVAQRIRRLLDESTLVWVRNPKGEGFIRRPVEESDIAILLRSGSNQMTLERFLRLYGIQYKVQTDRSFFLDALATDMSAFLAVILTPDDQASWVTLGRSPFLNLSNDGLLELSDWALDYNPEVEPPNFSLAEDKTRWLSFQNLYMRVHGFADRARPGVLADVLWDQGGYGHFVSTQGSARGFQAQFEFFRAYLDSFADHPLSVLVQELRQRVGTFEKVDELRVLTPGSTGVCIMSVHGSKGLEFPVVVLADLGNSGRNSTGKTSPGVFANDQEGLAQLILHYGFTSEGVYDHPLLVAEKEREQFAQAAELQRLFYVACTRAEQHLLFFGSYTTRNRKDLALPGTKKRAPGSSPYPKSFLHLLMGAYLPDLFDSVDLNSEDEFLELKDHKFADGLSLRVITPPTSNEWETIRRAQWSARPRPSTKLVPIERRGWDPIPLVISPSLVNSDLVIGTGLGSEHEALTSSEPRSEESALRARTLGTLTHGFLELALRVPGPLAHSMSHALGTTQPVAGLLPNQLQILLDQTYPKAPDRQAALAEAWDLADHFLSGPLAEKIRARLPSALYSEIPFLLYAQENETWVRGTVDLVAEFTDQRTRWIIDFKTDQVLNPDHYRTQVGWYLRAMTDMVLGPDVSTEPWRVQGYLVGLRTGEVFAVEPQ